MKELLARIALLLTAPLTMIVMELRSSLHWWAYFEYTHYIRHIGDLAEFSVAIGGLSFIAISTLFIFVHVVGMRMRNENSLTAWQPKIPNYLQVLTGEEPPKQGLRYRTTFWNDLLLVGLGLCIIQALSCERYFHPVTAQLGNQHYYIPVFVISFIAYLVFAIFFAGIPRKRYYGYIYLGSFIALLDTVFALFFDPWQDRFAIIFQFWDIKTLAFRRLRCYNVRYGQLPSDFSY